MKEVVSKDGTRIAFERTGSGPALILVDGALCSRAFGPMPKLAAMLADHFTVYWYDRRGRGDSADTLPYDTAREVEDLAALVEAAGGSAFVAGLSSGAALAMEAAASGVNVTRVVAYEPPYVAEGTATGEPHHIQALQQLLAAGDRGGAVEYFMKTMVGLPSPFVLMMRVMPGLWRKMKAVAHTLPYDAAVMRGYVVPRARLASIRVPTLVMHGSKTDARIQRAARAVAEAVPRSQHRTLPGQTHNVKPEVLSPAMIEFLGA